MTEEAKDEDIKLNEVVAIFAIVNDCGIKIL